MARGARRQASAAHQDSTPANDRHATMISRRASLHHRQALILAWAISAAGPALAFDFELIVPVRLHGLDRSISQGKVTCTVFGEPDKRVIGGKQVIFPVNTFTGEFERDLVLRFDVAPGEEPARASHYRCALDLFLPWANPPWQRPDAQAGPGPLHPLEGTAFSPEVSAPLPSAGPEWAPGVLRPPPYPTRKPSD